MKTRYAVLTLLTVAGITTTARAQLPGYLAEAFRTERWVAYSPTGPSPMPASDAVIKDDLLTLKQSGFTGLVTYGCDGLKKQIPKIAREAGFAHIVLGVYNPTSRNEVDNAKALATLVDGYCIGNEGLLERQPRYTFDQLRGAMDEIKQWTGRPVATSEQIEDYYDASVGPQLIAFGDWLFPNVHPFWHGKTRQPEAAEWTRDEVNKLEKLAKGKLVVCKEVGLPTGSDDKEMKVPDQQAQVDYYSALRAFRVPFVYFEAFDQVWKTHHPVEPYWGIFDKSRHPKLVVSQLTRPVAGVTITEPSDNGKLSMRLGPEGGFFAVRGTVTDLGSDRELLLFVNTGDPAAFGWFLQLDPGEIDNGRWVAQAQIGNKLYPPKQGDKISLQVRAVPKAVAQRLREARLKDTQLRNTGIRSRDLPATEPQWRADAKDVEVIIVKPK